MTKKQCKVCGEAKPTSEYWKHKGAPDGLRYSCKPCIRDQARQHREKNRGQYKDRARAYHEANKELRNKRRKARYRENPRQELEKNKEWRAKNKERMTEWLRIHREKNKESFNAYKRAWRRVKREDPQWRANRNQVSAAWRKEKVRTDPAWAKRQREWQREWRRHRRATDPQWRLMNNVRKAVSYGLRNGVKRGRTWDNLEYSLDDLASHLEKQFDEHMTWDNYGSFWQLDHIFPCAKLPFDSFEHPNFRKLWALANLRPLRADLNNSKGARLDMRLLEEMRLDHLLQVELLFVGGKSQQNGGET